MRTHNTKTIVALTVAGALAGCDFHITNPNSPTAIGPNATAAQVASSVAGLLVTVRADYPNWVLKSSILGREGYRLDTADPRFTTELLAGPLDPSNNAFGGGQWQPEYRAIGAGYAILNVIGSAQIPDAQKSAVSGFVQTLQALAFLNILVAHTQDSIPIDVNRPVGGPLAPLVTNAVAYQHVVNLLDSARTSLATASTFPFDPGPGFAGFNTPATFITFNRALMARVRVYQASPGAAGGPCATCWDSALVALSQSFLSPGGSMDLGVYNVFSSGNQDLANALSQATASAINLAHPMVKDSAEKQAGGAYDKRFLAKTTDRGTAFTLACLTSGLSWTRYPTPNSSIPIIRNEELILLRAEAEWFAAAANKPQTISDINLIRQTSGGLAATTVTVVSSDSVFVNEILKQRLYSLLYEGGHRWIDMRRRGRLSQVLIDRPTGCAAAGIPKDVVFSTLPINSFEVQARQ
jgi:hypothetical protein